MRFLKSIHKYIPGFRQLSGQSMAVGATYYITAVVILFHTWYIGLIMLALPFLIFNLIDLNAGKGKRLPLAAACTAGAIVLLSASVAFSTGGLPSGASIVTPVNTPELFTPRPTAMASISGAQPSASETHTGQTPMPTISGTAAQTAFGTPEATAPAEKAQYAYVAARGGEVFHLPDCASAKRIKPENLIGFKTREEAIAAGLRPCKRCKP